MIPIQKGNDFMSLPNANYTNFSLKKAEFLNKIRFLFGCHCVSAKCGNKVLRDTIKTS